MPADEPEQPGPAIDLTGQVAVVTGAGRGLGRLYALDLARRGAAVVVNDLGGMVDGSGEDRRVADDVVAEIERAGGVAVASHDSVADPDGGAAVVRAAVERFGRLDAVVSNAGIFETAPFEDISPERWRRMLQVHLDGGFHVSRPAFTVMREQGHGRFVFVASSAGLFGQPEAAHYAAAKAGVHGLAGVIAIEGEAHGILANTVLPIGFTRMVTAASGGAEAIPEVAAFFDAIRPELVVPLVTYLASPECRLTHHAFSAGAGHYARVFVALGPGWTSASPTPESLAANLSAVTATTPFTVPTSNHDEVASLATRLGITP